MDFAAYLASESAKTQSYAARMLRSQGPAAEPHLPRLLECCVLVARNDHNALNKFEEALLCSGALTIGDVLQQVGFDTTIPTHKQLMKWLIDLSSSTHARVAGHAVWGLGLLGTLDQDVIVCLSNIIDSNLRTDDHEVVSLRAMALRMLARLNRDLAMEYKLAPAWLELVRARNWWLNNHPDPELERELAWLIQDS